MPEEQQKPIYENPIDKLATDYQRDLEMLRNMNPQSIMDSEIGIVKSIAMKHGVEGDVTRENFYSFKGQLSRIILIKFEKYVGVDLNLNQPLMKSENVLDDETSHVKGRLPKKQNQEVTVIED